jgi:hypothetical protein
MIFSEPRDPRLITVRRGGTLSDTNQHLLALWAAACAEHVLHFFEEVQPEDDRPRHAIEQARAWARGEITMSEARTAAGHAMAAARDLRGAARHAAYAAGQAAAPSSRTSPSSCAAPQPTRSRPRKLQPLKMNASKPAKRCASGSANSFHMRSGSWCLMTSVYAMMCAGVCLSVNQPGFAQNASPI